LSQLRKERALSLRELGALSGVSFDAINKLENERREAQPRTIRRLAEALRVEPKELLKGDT
jgi:transcriptional regulator with XRE-family HTH domain